MADRSSLWATVVVTDGRLVGLDRVTTAERTKADAFIQAPFGGVVRFLGGEIPIRDTIGSHGQLEGDLAVLSALAGLAWPGTRRSELQRSLPSALCLAHDEGLLTPES
jgi:hypothetical protein